MNITMVLQLAVNIFLLSSAVLLLLVSLILKAIRLSPVRRLVILSLFIFSSSLWFFIRNPVVGLTPTYPNAFEIVDVFCQYGISFFGLTYVKGFVNGWRTKTMKVCQIWTLLFVAVTSFMHFNTEISYADFMPLGALCNAVFVGCMGLCICWEAFCEKDVDTRRLLLSSIPILLSALLEIFNFLQGYAAPTSLFFFVGSIAFMLLQVFWFIKHLQEQARRSASMEKELSDARISMLISQIQPHFLFNALLSIKQLCDIQPQKASVALEHFSYFLRNNLDSISDPRPIPFKKEVQHVQDFLYLEKMRFDERLNIEWKLHYTEFLLPSLTLQPIVENAIRHGIMKKRDGGTLTIQSELAVDIVLITIRDDGVGFDTTTSFDESRPHIGIANVKKRIETQCGGSLLISSNPSMGTEVKIALPQKEEIYKNTCSGRQGASP